MHQPLTRQWAALASLLLASTAADAATVSELFGGVHVATQTCVHALLGSATSNDGSTGSVFIDSTQDPSGNCGTNPYCFPGVNNGPLFPNMAYNAAQSSGTNFLISYSGPTLTSDNHAPYTVVSSSYASLQQPLEDYYIYSTMVTSAGLQLLAVFPAINVLAGSFATLPVVDSGMGPCDVSGGQPNVTFCLGGKNTGNSPTSSASDPSQFCSEANNGAYSNSTAVAAQLFTAFYYNHNIASSQAFNLFDISAAFRQTSSNWSSGWQAHNNGFGGLDFNFDANGSDHLSNTNQIYLEGPGLQPSIGFTNGHALITLYLFPFRTTRRDHEEIFVFTSVPSLPAIGCNGHGSDSHVGNPACEYSLADITGAGGTIVPACTTASGSTAVGPTCAYMLPAFGTYYFAAFTVDSDATPNYSRAESYTVRTVTVTSAGCAGF